uniref:Putative rte ele1 orf1-h 1e-60-j 4 n=1 Tax=Ixodes ricinus TaxID=34613 RepID=A0A0K8REV2_IXORI
MSGSCFLIHSTILCLLIGAFNPFTFKVIIDMHSFIAIFFLHLCSSLTVFLPVLKANTLAFLSHLFGGDIFFENSSAW